VRSTSGGIVLSGTSRSWRTFDFDTIRLGPIGGVVVSGQCVSKIIYRFAEILIKQYTPAIIVVKEYVEANPVSEPVSGRHGDIVKRRFTTIPSGKSVNKPRATPEPVGGVKAIRVK